jgi:hypothetical protein
MESSFMAFTINGSLVADESADTQNAADSQDTSGNDVAGGLGTLVSNVPEFDLLLAQVVGVGIAPTSVSVSNANADNSTGSSLLTGFGADVTDLAFTDSAGDPLNGDVAKFGAGAGDFLMTADGYKIYLYSYTGTDLAGVDENNVVFGRKANADGTANASGDVVFAAYLQPTGAGDVVLASDAGAVGAKVWLVEYQPIEHGTDGSSFATHDDTRILFDPLYVTVSNRNDFSLEGAPSGQQLFLTFGDGTPAAGEVAIVVTANNPANQSGANPNSTADDINFNTGGTVNTGQGGGGTTLGHTNQMVDPSEGLYFTFVMGAHTGLSVPNLTHDEAILESNIQFSGLYLATGASFAVVQLQQDSQATVKISALNTALETGTSYLDGLGTGAGGDTLVNINYIKVSTFVKSGNSLVAGAAHEFTASGTDANTGVTVTFNADGSVTLVGVQASDEITYRTGNANGSLTHTRVLIENTGNPIANASSTNAAFDIGKFALTNSNTDTDAFQVLGFQDDGPTAALADNGGAVTIDETAGTQNDDTVATAVSDLFDTEVVNPGTDLSPAQFAASTTALVSTTGSSYGQDGAGSTVLSLQIVGGDGTDSLLDTTDGKNIKLFKEGGLIVGRYDAANGTVTADDEAAFAIALQQDGNVAVAQYVSLTQNSAGDGSGGTYDEAVDLTGLVNALVTVTDIEGDFSTATVAIGDDINFEDDNPTAALADGGGAVTIDETAGLQDDDTIATAVTDLFDTEVANKGTDLSPAQFAISTTALADSAGGAFGQDEEDGTTVLSLAIVGGDNTNSGLTTTDGKIIRLFKEGDLIVGRYDAANGAVTAADPAAFAIALLQDGKVAVAQYVSLTHTSPGNGSLGTYDEAVDLSGLINAVATVTDGDGDTSIATVGIGDDINFDDDGPSVAFGNLVGTGTVVPQTGFWTMAPGNDGLGTAGPDISLTGFTLVRPDTSTSAGTITSFAELAGSGTGGTYLFGGTLTGDFDNNAATANTSVDFSLTAFADGHYTLDLVQGFASQIVLSSADGSLDAGGPDPVRTLSIGSEDIVFFAAKPLAPQTGANSIQTGIVIGATDPTEAQLQTNPLPTYIGTASMNVSTSGIGVANNVLQGNNTAGFQADDESFVINPESLITAMKIYIDNSVAGYNTATEDLYYRIYYSDGSVSATTEVNSPALTAEAGGQVSFLVQREGTKLIDAVQLLMGRGMIKIPVIQFITENESLASDVNLVFSATVTDGDGDTATDSFSADLFANELANSAFDFMLAGASSVQDAFNIDLTSAKSTYQVTGFDAGNDKLVLLGTAPTSVSIDNSNADSIVSILEAGGQTTTVIVVGVDLFASDIV